jgi:hypothetical protein
MFHAPYAHWHKKLRPLRVVILDRQFAKVDHATVYNDFRGRCIWRNELQRTLASRYAMARSRWRIR